MLCIIARFCVNSAEVNACVWPLVGPVSAFGHTTAMFKQTQTWSSVTHESVASSCRNLSCDMMKFSERLGKITFFSSTDGLWPRFEYIWKTTGEATELYYNLKWHFSTYLSTSQGIMGFDGKKGYLCAKYLNVNKKMYTFYLEMPLQALKDTRAS